jgi:uncharacterized membrane protein
MSSKILKDLEELVTENVISLEVKQNISNYYQFKKAKQPNRLFAIFGVLGSMLVGLGLILILAHNWDDFSRSVKTLWAFVPLVIGQLFVGYTLWKNRNATWRETAATFLYFGIGASISLVSQVYNISGNMSTFLLTWILLATPLIYLTRSYAVTLLHVLFATIYACNVGYFNDDSPWMYLALLAVIAPFYMKKITEEANANSTTILHWLLPISILISLGAFISGDDSIGFVLYVVLFSVFYNVGKLTYFKNASLRSNGFLVLGSIGIVGTLLTTSLNWIWDEFKFGLYSVQDYVMTAVLVTLVIVLLVFQFKKKPLKEFNLLQFSGLIFVGIYAVQELVPGLPVFLVNILTIAIAVIAIVEGARRNLFSILNYGLLIITALIAFRLFDSNISFVLRGLLFVAIGTGFFAANYFMYRKQSQLKISKDE